MYLQMFHEDDKLELLVQLDPLISQPKENYWTN